MQLEWRYIEDNDWKQIDEEGLEKLLPEIGVTTLSAARIINILKDVPEINTQRAVIRHCRIVTDKEINEALVPSGDWTYRPSR